MQRLTNSYLGQYQLIEVIGRSSMSTIYKAYQPSLNRHVAMKVLLGYLDSPFEIRFRREAQAIALLQHPHILPIYDYGEHEELLYFVTPYIKNSVTLGDLIRNPLDGIELLKVIELLFGALEYAHRKGMIHRDMKPSNVLIGEPHWPLLADFGIARLIDDSHGLTPPGQALGTALYMAPERASTHAADERSDLYSVGVMLYEIATGRVPFDAFSPIATLLKHIHEPPPPPRSIRPDIPEPLEVFLLKALAKDPNARYQTAAEMAYNLSCIRGAMIPDRAVQKLIEPPQRSLRTVDPHQTHEISTRLLEMPQGILPRTESLPRIAGPAPIDSSTPIGLNPDHVPEFGRYAYAALVALVLAAIVVLGLALQLPCS